MILLVAKPLRQHIAMSVCHACSTGGGGGEGGEWEVGEFKAQDKFDSICLYERCPFVGDRVHF